ncbi:hypothetical protein BMR1_03g02955 [Babesia microti strain RI]|uniref:Uncharacterized protein n=1 Tax=Babesia microti (strain RI) TaxID=1133968 RepID=A0A0K3AUC1_BABMR|nr:hypothetical protein BMR1_03g02955 [Babesia microti strain RI]CTQ41191.1 hypothetical protein BMR1_03g02955 [Babesia microti strain RI]|eukprot:XP_012649202.1 hypothetical protein BMR1_03g02955 [Babesia microti strain RI]
MALASQLYHSLGISEIIDNTIAKIEPSVSQELNNWATHNLTHTPQSNYPKLPPSGRITCIIPILKQLEVEIKGISDAEIEKLAHELKHLYSKPQILPRRFSARTTIDEIDIDLPREDAGNEFAPKFHMQDKPLCQFSNISDTPIYACDFFEKSSPDDFRRIITPVRTSWATRSQKNNSYDKPNCHSIIRSPFSKHNSYEHQNPCLTPDDIKWLESCKGTSQRIFGDELYSTPMGYNYPFIDSRPYTPIHHT